MRLRSDNSLIKLFTALFFLLTVWSMTLSARAVEPAESKLKPPEEAVDEYEVKSGDTLGEIALEHGIDLQELMELNKIDNADRIDAGTKIQMPAGSDKTRVTKRGVVAEVPKGFNLSRIAAAYEISVSSIVKANKLSDPDHLREGQKLLIPGVSEIVELVPPPPCFKDPVELYRVRTDETENVSLCYCNGKYNPTGLAVLSKLSAPPRKEMPFPLHPRLVLLLQHVAEKYPGKRLEIVSGQRVRRQKKHESYHTKGQAIDFRVEGVSNKDLVSFVKTFNRVGVGYYPNSVFIHLDTRDTNAFWIDYSRPGEKAIYGRKGMSEEAIELVREKRRKKKAKSIEREVSEAVDEFVDSLASNMREEPRG